jgi:2-keto-4-pentenoate hydratase/2-oxohepta-3-ene-1,7-dioic acid hydratase in catechol pathway
MKLVMFDDYRPGVLVGDRVVDATSAVADLHVARPEKLMPAIIEQFDRLRGPLERLAAAGDGRPRTRVRLRAPIPVPPKLIACFGNYMESAEQSRDQRSPQDMFLKNPTGVIGDGDTVELPPHKATVFHHEAELGVVIGRRAKDLSPGEAMGAVFGYTCFVDVSGRGVGTPGQNSRMGKSFDGFGPMGPCVTTRDEIPDPNDLQSRFWVDGELRQDYTTASMEYTVPEVVAFASQFMTLLPGDLISCGTHHLGLGPLQDGEHAEMEIAGIGKFGFNVRDPYKRSWPKGIDRTQANPGYRRP